MKQQVFKYLKDCSTQPQAVDRLIVSAFLLKNKLTVTNNVLLKGFIIQEYDTAEYLALTDFIGVLDKEIEDFGIEELIELFEFVISPEDRVVNGAVYTPLAIREYIVATTFKRKRRTITTTKIGDISCGCGGFLLTAAQTLKQLTKRSYADIFREQIFGLDIQGYSIDRTKLLLIILALSAGEDAEVFDFNLFVGDALTFKWDDYVPNFTGFGLVLGNPPYVCNRNLPAATKLNLKHWSVSQSGNSDLYIPFFQIGIENLEANGILGFITMNSFFKSLNGRALRAYFQEQNIKFTILDFGTEQVFKSKNTYTCICFIENATQAYIEYKKCPSNALPKTNVGFSRIPYEGLSSKNGWNLQDNSIISKIESTGVPLGQLYNTRHGIATLKNDIYIFKPVREDDAFYYLQNGSLFPIEKGICRDIVNSNKLSRSVELDDLKEKVIFPYNDADKPTILDEEYIADTYPLAYKYLKHKKSILATRDKGEGKYEKWFAFGRTQSLEKIATKMFFPKYSDRTPSFIINDDKDMLFYNGQAVVGHSVEEMLVIKKIMESSIFWYYIKTTSKPYSSNYFSLNGNYIRNFGICDLNDAEKAFILQEDNRAALDEFFEAKYDLTLNS